MSDIATYDAEREFGERAWYVARTKPRREEQTAVVLQQRGLEIYLPRLAVWTPGKKISGPYVRHNEPPHRVPTRLEPLFPGYLFARIDASSPEWVMARSAPGVAYFLGAQGHPTPIPADLVESIRCRSEAQQKDGVEPQFRTGDRVLIVSGPLAGLEAVFNGTLSASGRSRVFVQVLSRLVPVIIAADKLRRAG